MSQAITIALDAMGGDHGVHVVVPAALAALKQSPDLHLILVGDEHAMHTELHRHHACVGERLVLQHTSQQVGMDEPAAQALRGKKDSSMRVAIDLVKEGRAQACVSAGNTGALMATARFVLKTLPGVDRPAIISALPTIHGHTHMLDLGASSECSAQHLFEFAVMGSTLVSTMENIARPRVGLLNIGSEEIKGTDTIKEAARLMAESDLNYIGFVEGDDIYTDPPDVIVCDGFSGNIALKSSEGVARMIRHYLKQEFRRNLFTRLAALCALPVLKAFQSRIDPRLYNGATLIGLQGVVVKSHGGTDALGYAQAIKVAEREARKDVPRAIGEQLARRLQPGSAAAANAGQPL
ncbi:MAG: phosphate acyltransferase PlsX [Gammaproteobacteria bacterium]|nr:phosphate acyltransferase PlsX [Gammaproteobacteria bacterium]